MFSRWQLVQFVISEKKFSVLRLEFFGVEREEHFVPISNAKYDACQNPEVTLSSAVPVAGGDHLDAGVALDADVGAPE